MPGCGKQALLKARRIAGDKDLEEAFLAEVSSRIFNTPGELLRSAVYEMKQRTETQLVLKGHERGEVKLGEGSIRDIEFVVQFLQLSHGGRQPAIRSRNTLESLEKLRQAKILSHGDTRILTEGYVFLRTIEHHLQMMDYRQTHRLPTGAEAEEALARRLGFSGERAGEQFITQYRSTAAIRAIFLQYIETCHTKRE
jgi:glutamate-ammonia-ligase adenylyltransferase